MDRLIYEIAGKKYLLFYYPFTEESKAMRYMETVKQFGGIIQGAQVRPGWFSGKANIRALIPEEKAIEFSNYDFK